MSGFRELGPVWGSAFQGSGALRFGSVECFGFGQFEGIGRALKFHSWSRVCSTFVHCVFIRRNPEA